MLSNQHQNKNRLVLYRRRMQFTQKQVARLLGHADTSMLSRYERGRSLPPLAMALRLEIIYRVPVAFLYGGMYEQLRDEVRAEEARDKTPRQRPLF